MPEYLTQEKYDEFKQELENLKKVRRKEVAENLEYARSLGDLSENAEYHEARDMQAAVEDRINHLEEVLKIAQIISKHDVDEVSVGAKVTVERHGGQKEFTIVGSEESDMNAGKISVRSPFGEAILGKKKGESFSFSAPSGKVTYKIVAIV